MPRFSPGGEPPRSGNSASGHRRFAPIVGRGYLRVGNSGMASSGHPKYMRRRRSQHRHPRRNHVDKDQHSTAVFIQLKIESNARYSGANEHKLNRRSRGPGSEATHPTETGAIVTQAKAPHYALRAHLNPSPCFRLRFVENSVTTFHIADTPTPIAKPAPFRAAVRLAAG
jgi:hypothetical protein